MFFFKEWTNFQLIINPIMPVSYRVFSFIKLFPGVTMISMYIGVDFINPFMLYAKLLCSAPNFYA